MGRWLHSPKAPWLLTVLLLGLLLVLAVLQYRWTGELSRAEREGKAAALRDGLDAMTLEFDRQLMTIVLAMHLAPGDDDPAGNQQASAPRASDPRSNAARSGQDLSTEAGDETYPSGRRAAQGWRTWQQHSPYPETIASLYLAANPSFTERFGGGGGDASPRLLHLEEAEGSWRDIPWPEALEGIALPLDEWRRMLRRGARAEPPGLRSTGPRMLDPQVPAILLPLWDGMEPTRRRGHLPRWTLIIALDRGALESMLADLTIRHLGQRQDGEVEFVLRLLDRDDQELWSMGPAPPGRRSRVDGESRLFRLRSLEELDLPNDPLLAALGGLPKATGHGPTPIRTGHRDPDHDPDHRHGLRPPHRLRTLLSFAGGRGEGPWRLVATHGAGSLDAAVEGARRRNLWISSLICGLLAISLCLLLVSTQRAQRLARQQLEFVAGVTHELMTPLAAMRSAGENLADGVVREADQVKRYGRLVDQEGRRLSTMVAQILELSGMQSGRRTMTLEPVDLRTLISDALADCRADLDAAGFTVERRDQDLPAVMADGDALRRGLVNLLQNAAKYASEGDRLTITTGRRGGQAEIEILDRGPGIDAADLPHLFEPFRRGGAMAASSIPGSGLGLSLVKSIIEAHGGRIEAQNHRHDDGRVAGARFVIHLPLAADSSPSSEPPKPRDATST